MAEVASILFPLQNHPNLSEYVTQVLDHRPFSTELHSTFNAGLCLLQVRAH